jgi:hypothetical protein
MCKNADSVLWEMGEEGRGKREEHFQNKKTKSFL